MDFSPSSPRPRAIDTADPTPLPPAVTCADNAVQHWHLLCGAVLERLDATAAQAAQAAPQDAGWSAVLDAVAELQKLRALAHRAMAAPGWTASSADAAPAPGPRRHDRS